MRTKFNRREFTRKAALSALALSLPRVVADATTTASAAESPPPVIDSHTHFYDPTRPQGVPWPPRQEKLLYRKVLPADYRALPKPTPVAGTVVVEASAWIEDNQWILDLAANDPFIVGFVGHLTLGADDFPANLERFARNPVFRGIRIGPDAVKAALAGGAPMRHLHLLADRDLCVDLLVGPESLSDIAKLASAVPRLRMLVDHVCNIRIDGRPADTSWERGMQSAGERPNLFCKVSGLVEGSDRRDGKAPTGIEFYRPVLDVVWQAFGADRLVYASNWPVCGIFASCATVQTLAETYFAEKGAAASRKCFYQNSRNFYKWTPRAPAQGA
jgi:predicted TIM-barrel fold metal-dependent hydrolase